MYGTAKIMVDSVVGMRSSQVRFPVHQPPYVVTGAPSLSCNIGSIHPALNAEGFWLL